MKAFMSKFINRLNIRVWEWGVGDQRIWAEIILEKEIETWKN